MISCGTGLQCGCSSRGAASIETTDCDQLRGGAGLQCGCSSRGAASIETTDCDQLRDGAPVWVFLKGCCFHVDTLLVWSLYGPATC